MPNSQTLHIHKAKLYEPFNVFLLLIPPLLFVLTLAAIFLSNRSQNKFQAINLNETSVLGEDSGLDK